MNEKIILTADNYNLIDGRNAYHSPIKRLTLGKPTKRENQNMQIAAQLWKENEQKELESGNVHGNDFPTEKRPFHCNQ